MGTPGIRPAASDYERDLDRALDYYGYADRFGWNSDTVDNERAWLLDRYPVIQSAIAEAQAIQQRRQSGG